MEPVRFGLRKIVGELLRSRPAEEAVLIAWPLVCGKEVAQRTTAISFAEGSLTVGVPDGTWRGELAAFTPRYLSGFESLMGPVVREVVFKVQPSALSNQHSVKTSSE